MKIIKLLTATARNHFLLLVKMNIGGMKRKLKSVILKDDSEIRKKWESLGGDYNELISAVFD